MLTEHAAMGDNISRQTAVIAVVIPVFNCKEYLREAVDSVLGQPYQEISIVLVDDGSTDGSGQLCDELAKESNRVAVLHQKNAGVSAARNAGIEYILAQSDSTDNKQYIAFLDADDCWTENFFNNDCVKTFPETTIIRFQSVNCNSTLDKCADAVNVVEGIYDGGASIVHKCLSGHFGAALYASSLFHDPKIRFIEGLKHSEDVLFLRTCAYNADSVAMLNRILYLYRNNPTSCVHTNTTSGFAYFDPILHAYLTNDYDGVGFVSWYVVDAIEDHFKYGGTVLDAKRWAAKHSAYIAIAKEHGGDRATKALTALEKYPYFYAGKLRLRGIAFSGARKLIHSWPISRLFDAYRYKNAITRNQ